jgi:hypothetical protein
MTELQNVGGYDPVPEDGNSEGDAESNAEETELCSGRNLAACGCCCLCTILIIGLMALRWHMWPKCSGTETALSWNSMIPANTTMQFRHEFFALSSEVEVYNTTQLGATMEMGYWSDIRVMFTRYSYFDTRAGEQVRIEAKPPFGWYWGLRYKLWRCGDTDGDTFHIEEDVWARPWFNLENEKVFKIARGTNPIGKSFTSTKNHLLGSLFSSKEIMVTDMQDEEVATIKQESQMQAGFSNRRYFVHNVRPDVIPNEVVSFLAGVWELNGIGEKSKSSHTSHSHSRR